MLIVGIQGACRKQELKNILLEHIQDTGTSFIVHIPDTKTKTERTFVIAGNLYKICLKYLMIRKQVSSDIKFFFLNYQNGKCVRQAVGINKFGSIPKEIAKYLKLPEPEAYTGHCFRRSSATILVDAGGDLLALKRHGG